MSNFENAIQAYAAKQEAISTIITGNEGDFTEAGLTLHNPTAQWVLALFEK